MKIGWRGESGGAADGTRKCPKVRKHVKHYAYPRRTALVRRDPATPHSTAMAERPALSDPIFGWWRDMRCISRFGSRRLRTAILQGPEGFRIFRSHRGNLHGRNPCIGSRRGTFSCRNAQSLPRAGLRNISEAEMALAAEAFNSTPVCALQVIRFSKHQTLQE